MSLLNSPGSRIADSSPAIALQTGEAEQSRQILSTRAVWKGLSLPVRAMLGLAIVSIIAIYIPTLLRLTKVWYEDPDYSHGFLVIPASLFFCGIAWQRLAEGGPLPAVERGVMGGMLQIVLGVVLHWIALLIGLLILDVLSLVCVVRGVLKLVVGNAINDAFAFPALFLLFMAPLPPQVHQGVAIVMQQLVALVSTTVLEACGVPVFREGYLIHLPDYTMEVGEACSGLRSMIAILALGVAMGFLLNGPSWYRWTLGLVALPIAGIANCIRVVMTGAILMTLGPKYAEDMFHTMEGLVIVILAALMLVGVAMGLRSFIPSSASPAPESS